MRFFLFFSFIFMALNSSAYETIFNMGIGHSNQKISSIANNKSFSMMADGGGFFNIGKIIPITNTHPQSFEAQITLGFKVSSDGDDSQNEIDWFRVPIEIGYYYRNYQEDFRIGYGFIYQYNDKLDGSGNKSSMTTALKNSKGLTITFEKVFSSPYTKNRDMLVGIKYSNMEIENKSNNTKLTSHGLYLYIGGIAFE